jgi:hypothetical protein
VGTIDAHPERVRGTHHLPDAKRSCTRVRAASAIPPWWTAVSIPAACSTGAAFSARAWLWAELMRRSFGFDVLACPRCGDRLELIALIDNPSVIRRILSHLGLPTEVPAARPARPPPLPMGDRIRGTTTSPLLDSA